MAVFLALAVLLALWPLTPVRAQDSDDPTMPPLLAGQDLRFEHLTVQDGLAEGRVWGMTQDRRGFMWFATLGGLNRYDGYEFQVYREGGDNPNSPGGRLFWTVYEDQQGMIWVGSLGNGGLSRFDPSTEQWTRFQHDPSDPHSLSSNNVQGILEDRFGVLWIGTNGGGLNRFDGEDEGGRGRFTRYQHDPDDLNSLGSDSVVSIFEDRSGILWMGGFSGGLNRFDSQTETFTRYQHDPQNLDSLSDDAAFTIYEDQSGVLWVGTYGGGLNRFDRDTETFTRYQAIPEDPSSLSSNTVIDILEDQSGTLYIATWGGGLNRYHPESDSFTSFQHDSFDSNSLGSDTLASLFVDNSGTLWIGTAGNGISKLDPRKQGFGVIRHNPGDANSLSHNDVRAVFEDRSGDLWIGTYGGLNRYEPETGRYTRYLHDVADPTSLSDNHVWAISEDSTGALWVGTDPHGLNRFDRDTETFTHFRSDPADPCSLIDDVIISLHTDRTGTLWIGTWTGGLDAFDPLSQDEQACFTHYQHDPDDPRSLGEGYVTVIFEDQTGVLWVGTSSGGLCRLDRDTDTFACYQHDPEDRNSLSGNSIYAINEDRVGTLWIGTVDGLDRLDPETGKFLRYTTADGLANPTVFDILEDEDRHLWVSTAHGLSYFDPAARTFRTYTASDGLPGNVFRFDSGYKASTGELFFGGADGLTHFYPDDILDNAYIPPVHITGIQLANKPVTVGGDSPLQASALDTEELVLFHEDRIISFEFAALDFGSPEKNRYKYKLEGFDEDWHETDSTRRFATYTNLDPGEYTFRVLGSNNSSVWNEEGDSLKLTITPPWWETWWSRVGALLLLGGMVAVGFVWQWQSGKRQERQLAATVTERTHELNERVKELDCLFGISRLAGQQGISLEQILEGVAALLPPAMQYPEIACARIVLDGREFKTDNFRETPWQQSSTIVVRGEQAGQAEVGFLEERPDADEGPFLEEEQLLLSAVAERLGRITERKRAEEALRESELRLELAVAGSEGGLWSIDLDPGDPSHGIPDEIYLSPRVKGFLGYEDEEFPNSMAAWESHVRPEDLPRLQETSQRFLQDRIPRYELEYRIRHKDGSVRWIRSTGRVERDEDGRPFRFAGIDWDITERYQAEEALRESEEQYRDLVEKISDVIYSVDAEGLITYLNPAIESLLGLPPGQVVGQPFTRFIHPEDLGRLQGNTRDLLSGDVPGSAEYRVLNALGETRWIRVTSQPIAEEGRVTGLQGVLIDITERKAVEAQLEEAATAAERQRLARELHDSVTQSLHSASLIAETVQLKWEEDPEEGRRGLEHLQRFTQGALAEMRTLLLELNPKALEAQELPVLLRQLAQAMMARTQTFVTMSFAGECTVPVEIKVALYRIAQEALNNVVKHAGAQRARVNLQCLEAHPGEGEGAQTILSIRDDGCGFDPEGAQSSGLGIGILHDRAREIDATLSITSQPDLGTEVLVEWPAGQA